ncbi:MAG: aquaporin family protein [Bacteroidetes bacterium]|nr:aquaporin family protein [Bacteroidota bacterium]MBS1609064.1 aquaporin family protein [Bacteroidota bacterium]
MSNFTGEFIGTALLIILGDGIVANVLLDKTKGNNGGLISITFGWSIAVFTGVFVSLALGGKGHLNPAVTIAMASIHQIDTALIAPYLLAQFTGAFTGSIIVWLAYKNHFDSTTNSDFKLAVFCTGPAIRNPFFNTLTEIIGTFVLVFGALLMSSPEHSLGALNALPVGLLVLGIGLSLGGPTGYAINPARDLGPRIAHFILPIPGKRNSDWGYSWVPVIGPIIGALIAAFLFKLL